MNLSALALRPVVNSLCALFLLAGSVLANAAPAADAHPEKGPHGGPLLELGNEEFHLEVLLDDKTNTLTVYVLDAAAKALVPIEAPELLVNLKHAGKPQQHRLKAERQKTDPEGMSSAFQLKSASLMHSLHHKDHGARVAVKIRGKSYSAKFTVDHDHDHDHDDKGKEKVSAK